MVQAPWAPGSTSRMPLCPGQCGLDQRQAVIAEIQIITDQQAWACRSRLRASELAALPRSLGGVSASPMRAAKVTSSQGQPRPPAAMHDVEIGDVAILAQTMPRTPQPDSGACPCRRRHHSAPLGPFGADRPGLRPADHQSADSGPSQRDPWPGSVPARAPDPCGRPESPDSRAASTSSTSTGR